jgi:protein TonB
MISGAAGEHSATATRLASDGGQKLLVLSRDRELIDALEIAGFPNEVHAIRREADLVASLLAQQAALVVLDAAAVARSIERVTEGLKSQFPDVVLIVAGRPSDQGVLAAQITDGTVYRFLVKPISPQRIKLFLDAAWRRGQRMTNLDLSSKPRPLDTTAAQGTGSRLNTWLIVAIVAIAVLTGWLALLKVRTAPPSASATRTSTASASDTDGPSSNGSLGSVLERGEAALRRGELGSAAELYRKAQQISPSEPRVVEGLTQVMQKILAAAHAQLQDGHLEQAEQLTRQAWNLEPGSRQVALMLTQLAEARERRALPEAPAPATPAVARAAPQAREADRPRPAGKLEEYLRRAQERMHEGNLLDPQDSSARYFIAQARALAPADPAVRQAERQLLGQVTGEARNALTANHPDEAERWIAAASELGARPDEVASFTREVQLDRAAAKAAATDKTASLFNERMSQGRILDPADDCAKFYLAQLIRSEPNKPSTQLARGLLQARVLAEAQSAVRHQNYASARRWLAEARDADVDATSLAAIESDIQNGQPATRAPAAPIAPPPPKAQLQLTHYVEPEYPSRYWLGRSPPRIKGTVNVQFTVNAEGATTNVKVISAQPPGVFEHAAIEAVSKWRYQPPVQEDGRPTQVQTQVRLIFEP